MLFYVDIIRDLDRYNFLFSSLSNFNVKMKNIHVNIVHYSLCNVVITCVQSHCIFSIKYV